MKHNIRPKHHVVGWWTTCLTLLFNIPWQAEKKKLWDELNQEEIAKAIKRLDEFDQVAEHVAC